MIGEIEKTAIEFEFKRLGEVIKKLQAKIEILEEIVEDLEGNLDAAAFKDLSDHDDEDVCKMWVYHDKAWENIKQLYKCLRDDGEKIKAIDKEDE